MIKRDNEQKTPKPDFAEGEFTIISCLVNLLMGIGITIGGLAVLFIAIFMGIGWKAIIICTVLFLLCLAVGVCEVKSAIGEIKKIR